MTQAPRPAPMHVPILTEVIEVPDLVDSLLPLPMQTPQPAADPADVPMPMRPAVPAVPATASLPQVVRESAMASPVAPLAIDEALLTQRVLAEVQRQIDGMLEFRLREAMAPILARSAEALVRELRQELARTMSDVVTRSVAQELARQRPRG